MVFPEPENRGAKAFGNTVLYIFDILKKPDKKLLVKPTMVSEMDLFHSFHEVFNLEA